MGEMSTKSARQLRIPLLGRVRGRCALDVDIEGDRVTAVRLRLVEPPRLFERLLEGQGCDQVVDAVARICGHCPVAYQLAAAQAFERLFQLEPPPWVVAMRRALSCGEWLQSHALHIHLLAAPDFLGLDDVLAMTDGHAAALQRGLRLHALGADVVRLFGGRLVHPVGVRVGGFYRAPACAEVASLVERLAAAIPEAEDLVRWVASLGFPADEQPFTSVALGHPHEYALGAGRIQSGDGLDVSVSQFAEQVETSQVPHSSALHARIDGRPYLVGPLARLNLNFRELPPAVRVVLDTLPTPVPTHNTFHSIVARAVEVLLAVREAHALLQAYEPPAEPAAVVRTRAGTAVGATESPQGLLWLRFQVDARGTVRRALILSPTAQNQVRCEEDLRTALERFGLDRSDSDLQRHAERVIRNYDPCMACAAHALRLRVAGRAPDSPSQRSSQNSQT
jgi:coenzyme F420-reducing hydrogenase alpha subunit